MPETRFIRPLDVLFFRTNKLFGEAGQHGEIQMPPWPSVIAGAIRSRMLADYNIDINDFIENGPLPDPLSTILGTTSDPGSFRIAWFSIAKIAQNTIEPFIPLPADLYTHSEEDRILYIKPQKLPERLSSSCVTDMVAVLKQNEVKKPQTNLWLNTEGLKAYLHGELLNKKRHAVETGRLWNRDMRLGIALDPQRRVAETGRIYTSEIIVMKPDAGFVVSIDGADGMIPYDGLIRFGGDGRGAEIQKREFPVPEPDWDRIGLEKQFRIILTTPGLFKEGWLLSGMDDRGVTWYGPDGVTARLVSAVVPRHKVVSGWNLATNVPKPAIRAVPPGSVYWFKAHDTDSSALVEALKKLVKHGLGLLSPYPDRTRLCEGFNNVMIANWANISQ